MPESVLLEKCSLEVRTAPALFHVQLSDRQFAPRATIAPDSFACASVAAHSLTWLLTCATGARRVVEAKQFGMSVSVALKAINWL